ncbi:MAG: SRPBCC family protein [Nitrospirae bacterium]|nr:SRPBCC family protein [Nitrospirota bacterium]MBI3351044.1 SRPBCC family protein [Nitrospirota bacterium]
MTRKPDDEMPTTALGKMCAEGDHATLVFNRIYPHAINLVWDAITDPEQVKSWFMSSFKIDARPGGTVDLVSGPAQFHSVGRILAWEPPCIFEYEWKVAPRTELPIGEDAVVRWELVASGASTVVTVTYRRLTKQTALGFTPGLHTFLDRLAAQLDRKPLPDWMSRFGEVQRLYPGWK